MRDCVAGVQRATDAKCVALPTCVPAKGRKQGQHFERRVHGSNGAVQLRKPLQPVLDIGCAFA